MSELPLRPHPGPGDDELSTSRASELDRLRAAHLASARGPRSNGRSRRGPLLRHEQRRYITSTNIGEWARGKLMGFAVLPRGGEPVLWDFGSAAKAHRLHALDPSRELARRDDGAPRCGGSRCGVLRASRARGEGRPRRGRRGSEPLGLDIAEMPPRSASTTWTERSFGSRPPTFRSRRRTAWRTRRRHRSRGSSRRSSSGWIELASLRRDAAGSRASANDR